MKSADYVSGVIGTVAKNDIFTAVVLLAASVIGAGIIYFVLEKYVSKLTKATKTTLDDELLHALKRPLYFAALVVGAYFSLAQVESLQKHSAAVDKLFIVLGVAVGVYTIARLITTLLNWYAANLSAKTETRVDERFMPIVRKVVSVFIYLIGLVVILDQLGIKVTALVASLGVASLAVALALQETLANFFSGLYIMADKPFRIGDFIKTETGEEGFVEEIGWRSTRIKLRTEVIVVIPNSKLAQSKVTNYCLPEKEANFLVECGVAYGSDLEHVEKVTVSVADDVLKAVYGSHLKGFKPVVAYHSFGDSNINFSVVMRAKDYADKPKITHEFIKALTKGYKKEGINISWPVRKVYLSSGNVKD